MHAKWVHIYTQARQNTVNTRKHAIGNNDMPIGHSGEGEGARVPTRQHLYTSTPNGDADGGAVMPNGTQKRQNRYM